MQEIHCKHLIIIAFKQQNIDIACTVYWRITVQRTTR